MALPATGYGTADVEAPGASLTDFSLLIDLREMHASWWAAVDTAVGAKGRAAKDDETELATDWIDFDDSGETGWLRVKWSGTLSGTPTIRIYPPVSGNATLAVDATYGSDNAYDANWEAYYPDGLGVDRTANDLNLTAVGSPSVGGAAGKVGAATALDGSTQYGYNTSLSGPTIPVTVTLWAKPATVDDNDTPVMVARQTDSTNTLIRIRQEANDDKWTAQTTDGGNNPEALSTVNEIDTSNYQHLVARFQNANPGAEIMKNNASEGTDADVAASIAHDTVVVGCRYLNNGGLVQHLYEGEVNEVQVHSTLRDDDWVDEEYSQSNDNATFWGSWGWTAPAASGNPWYAYAQQQ